jgi:hypothetical protein
VIPSVGGSATTNRPTGAFFRRLTAILAADGRDPRG